MKNLFFMMFLFFANSMYAQNTVTVSGIFKENYRAAKISQEVNRLLFVKTKGHLKLSIYGFGYFLNLNKTDATKLGFDDILVIPLANEITPSDKNVVTLELIQLSANEPSVFYTKQKNINLENNYSKIFNNPTLKDTVIWDEINQSGMLYTKQWIDHLDDEKEVTLKSYIVYHTNNGSGSTDQFSKIKMKELAKEHLHQVSNLFFGGGNKDWNKKQWQDWFQKTINSPEPLSKDCNLKNYAIEDIYRYGESNTMLFNKDSFTNKIFAVQMLPYNVDQYKDRQIIVVDDLKNAKYDFYTEKQKQVFNIRAFESLNKQLYFFDYDANWSRFELNNGQYIFKEKKEIALPETAGMRSDSYVTHLQSSSQLIYAITKNKKTKQLYAIVLNTQTGETIEAKALKDLMVNTAINLEKEIDLVFLKYGLKSSTDFVFGIKQGDEFYLVKTDKTLTSLKLIKASKDIVGATLFVHDKKIDVLKSDRNDLLKISFDKDLTKLLSKQHKIIENWYYDEDGLVVFDGLNYKLFAPYQLKQHSGIQLLTLNDRLETIKKKCVYQFLPLEEPEYDNMVHLQYANKLNKEWCLLFRQGTSFKYVTVGE